MRRMSPPPVARFRCATKRTANVSCVTARLRGLEEAAAAAGLEVPWTLKSFRHRRVYSFSGSPYKICRSVSK